MPGIGEDFGLAELRAADADRAGLYLPAARSTGLLWVFACGRSSTPAAVARACIAAIFARDPRDINSDDGGRDVARSAIGELVMGNGREIEKWVMGIGMANGNRKWIGRSAINYPLPICHSPYPFPDCIRIIYAMNPSGFLYT